MDGVTVFFASASAAQVRAHALLSVESTCVSRGEVHFFLRPYDGWPSELDDTEREAVVSRLGCIPSSVFSVEARHGTPARFALEWLAACSPRLGTFVVDDDFGHLHSVADVEQVLQRSSETDLYAMRAPEPELRVEPVKHRSE
jgi:hypothetical protein